MIFCFKIIIFSFYMMILNKLKCGVYIFNEKVFNWKIYIFNIKILIFWCYLMIYINIRFGLIFIYFRNMIGIILEKYDVFLMINGEFLV